MLRMLCGSSGGPLGAAELAALQQLAESRSQLLLDSGATDIKSEAGYTACAVFLSSVDNAAQAFGMAPTPRGYRSSFSANYRALFPDGGRHYRVDVLEASVDQQFDIWVNSERFELSAEAIELATTLQVAWVELVGLLDQWPAADPSRRLSRTDFVAAIAAFDAAWAAFESKYIGELIAIEERARQLVVNAVILEAGLPSKYDDGSLKTAETEGQFVQCIATLNSIANHRRKGRDDLGAGVLASARAVLRQCLQRDQKDPGVNGRRRDGSDAARILAGDVIASYTAMRSYIRRVGGCIEHVDPHLCNNAGLVARLVDYEESWEIGARYVQHEPLLGAICDIVAEVRAAQEIAPELGAMIEDCDVELFLVLPRLVVLSFLADPRARRAELVRSLLPHRFGPADGRGAGCPIAKVHPELKTLYSRYKDALQFLGSGSPSSPSTPSDKIAVWEGLVRQAVLGVAEDADPVTRELLRSVETWSLELQRHCPEDWNQCSAVLVHCLTGGAQKEPPPSKFTV